MISTRMHHVNAKTGIVMQFSLNVDSQKRDQ